MLGRGDINRKPDRSTGLMIKSVVRMFENVIELGGRIRGQKLTILIDSESTGNFISTKFVEQCELKV